MSSVLIIDDDRASRLILAQWLAKAGWEVFQADDGEMGLSIIEKQKPDALVCDLLMPRYNGFQVCRTIRSKGSAWPQPKIVVMTASGYATDRLNALEAGADEFLVKPIKRDGLINLLDNLTKATSVTEFIRRSHFKVSVPEDDTPQTNHRKIAMAEGSALVRFWGVRGSIPTPGPSTAFYGGNTSCVEVRADGEIIVLDAGTGIRPLGLKLVTEFSKEPIQVTVLLTHTHWDHIQGFPFFVPAYSPKNRLRLLGYEGARAGLEGTLSSQMESPYFPISMQQMPGYIECQELKDMEFNVGSVEVQAQFMNHPGVCVGFRLTTSAGIICYLPDNEPFLRMKADPGKLTPKEHADALEFARAQDQKLIEFIKDADILIMDSQYDASEYPRHVGWGHTCVDDSVAFALNANAKQLFLFHHDPGHDDKCVAGLEAHAQELVSRQAGHVKVHAAREGVEILLERNVAPATERKKRVRA